MRAELYQCYNYEHAWQEKDREWDGTYQVEQPFPIRFGPSAQPREIEADVFTPAPILILHRRNLAQCVTAFHVGGTDWFVCSALHRQLASISSWNSSAVQSHDPVWQHSDIHSFMRGRMGGHTVAATLIDHGLKMKRIRVGTS
jgi:hypothetical protein